MTFRYRRLSNSPDGGDMNFGHGWADFIADTPQTVAQSIYTRLLLWQGEYWLDLNAGTPWLQQVLGKPVGPGNPDLAIRSRIARTPFVTAVLDYASYFNPTQRSWSVSCKVDTFFGLASLDFILPVPTLPAQPPSLLPPPVVRFTGILAEGAHGTESMVGTAAGRGRIETGHGVESVTGTITGQVVTRIETGHGIETVIGTLVSLTGSRAETGHGVETITGALPAAGVMPAGMPGTFALGDMPLGGGAQAAAGLTPPARAETGHGVETVTGALSGGVITPPAGALGSFALGDMPL
jgi:hypothetical protein